MVEEDVRRSRKYEKKIIGDVVGKRYDDVKKKMVRSERNYMINAVAIENEIKLLINDVGSFGIIYYIIFAKELIKMRERHAGYVLLDEVRILREKWEARGLDRERLKRIEMLYIPRYCVIARFDVGRFNINCFE